MNRIEFNMRLNALISDFFERGGDPAIWAEDLGSVAKEIFEDLVKDPCEQGDTDHA